MKKIILLSGLLIGLFSGVILAQGQSAIIQGKIVDGQNQETLPSVNIVEIDKNGRFIGGTVSDLNGNYVFKVSNVANNVQISFIGYQKETFTVDGRTEINVQLQPETVGLDEVVIVGEKMGKDIDKTIESAKDAIHDATK